MLATYPMVRGWRSHAGFLMAAQPTLRSSRCIVQAPPKSSRRVGRSGEGGLTNRNIWPKLLLHGRARQNSEAIERGEIIKQW